jgi:hypothetical protein
MLGAPIADSLPAGHALLVFPAGRLDPRAQLFAAGLAADHEHLLVVADWPVVARWEPVARLIAPEHRAVRLVVGRPGPNGSQAIAHWLVFRLGQAVIAADGAVVPAAGGGLFVRPGSGAGWLRYEPDGPPRYLSRRFPQPAWDRLVPEGIVPAGTATVAEPLPAGTWLRPRLAPDASGIHQKPLLSDLSSHPEWLYLVLGCPGADAVLLADIASYWRTLPGEARATVRFVRYGPVQSAEPALLGQALADRLGATVAVHGGTPAALGPVVVFQPARPL